MPGVKATSWVVEESTSGADRRAKVVQIVAKIGEDPAVHLTVAIPGRPHRDVVRMAKGIARLLNESLAVIDHSGTLRVLTE